MFPLPLPLVPAVRFPARCRRPKTPLLQRPRRGWLRKRRGRQRKRRGRPRKRRERRRIRRRRRRRTRRRQQRLRRRCHPQRRRRRQWRRRSIILAHLRNSRKRLPLRALQIIRRERGAAAPRHRRGDSARLVLGSSPVSARHADGIGAAFCPAPRGQSFGYLRRRIWR